MKDVRQLVHDHQTLPAVVGLERGIGDRRHEEYGEAIGGINRCESVGRVYIVRKRQVDGPARRMQLAREQSVGALGFRRRDHRARPQAGAEVDAEVLGVEGAPAA